MIAQYILLGLMLLASIMYLARKAYKPFKAKDTCAENCGKCGALENIEAKENGTIRKKPF